MRKEGRAIERRRSSSDPTQSQTPFGSASSGSVPDSGSWILDSGFWILESKASSPGEDTRFLPLRLGRQERLIDSPNFHYGYT